MTNFSQKAPFNLAEYLSRPATPAEIQRAAAGRKKHKEFMEGLEAAREREALRRKS
ncbi:hypothetical protein [Pseudogemmobacter humi]|uniref:Uncharacterized protein n=1 Tax=Pseudogemmobacter humi TaxID=2483812 RepID=A0A3P5XAK1_9RHOB|nr:hypothetical protein [Pseudogemmobacter humi]VDC31769.1 hypothetical protein XINFAN_03123 [Pseudogemmobacter humi]